MQRAVASSFDHDSKILDYDEIDLLASTKIWNYAVLFGTVVTLLSEALLK